MHTRIYVQLIFERN